MERLQSRVAALERHEFSALRFLGGGTDLVVGLLEGAVSRHVGLETQWDSPMVVNMPSERCAALLTTGARGASLA